MKTTVRATVPKRDSYGLHHLENAAEIRVLIKEVEAKLSPCAHCGFTRPVILYEYFPEIENPLRQHPPLPAMHPSSHEFCVWCNEFDLENKRTYGCRMRTGDDSASDDEMSIREALDRLVRVWNRRPPGLNTPNPDGSPAPPVAADYLSSEPNTEALSTFGDLFGDLFGGVFSKDSSPNGQ